MGHVQTCEVDVFRQIGVTPYGGTVAGQLVELQYDVCTGPADEDDDRG